MRLLPICLAFIVLLSALFFLQVIRPSVLCFVLSALIIPLPHHWFALWFVVLFFFSFLLDISSIYYFLFYISEDLLASSILFFQPDPDPPTILHSTTHRPFISLYTYYRFYKQTHRQLPPKSFPFVIFPFPSASLDIIPTSAPPSLTPPFFPLSRWKNEKEGREQEQREDLLFLSRYNHDLTPAKHSFQRAITGKKKKSTGLLSSSCVYIFSFPLHPAY